MGSGLEWIGSHGGPRDEIHRGKGRRRRQIGVPGLGESVDELLPSRPDRTPRGPADGESASGSSLRPLVIEPVVVDDPGIPGVTTDPGNPDADGVDPVFPPEPAPEPMPEPMPEPVSVLIDVPIDPPLPVDQPLSWPDCDEASLPRRSCDSSC